MDSWTLANLDDETRGCMLEELEADLEADATHPGAFYRSKNFNEQGIKDCIALVQRAIEKGSADTLARALDDSAYFRESYLDSRGRKYRVNFSDAAKKYAHGEFNRFYLRGLCLRAARNGIEHLVIYRAKASEKPRPESEAMIGKLVPVKALLADLRENKGLDAHLGLPPGPHSGLSARLR